MIFSISNVFAENQATKDNLTNYTQLIGYYLCKYNFKDFVETPTVTFAENNSCIKINYSEVL